LSAATVHCFQPASRSEAKRRSRTKEKLAEGQRSIVLEQKASLPKASEAPLTNKRKAGRRPAKRRSQTTSQLREAKRSVALIGVGCGNFFTFACGCRRLWFLRFTRLEVSKSDEKS